MFDLDGDGHINMEELRHLLSGDGGSAMVSDLLPDGQTVDEAEAMGKVDENYGKTDCLEFSGVNFMQT